MFAWGVLVFGATVTVFSGRAAPLFTPEMIPMSGPLSLFVFAASLLAVGGTAIWLLKRRAWRRAGRGANLTPDGGGLLGNKTFAGTVAGRAVRAKTITRKTGSSDEGGSSKTTYTVVEADLDEPATEGLVIGTGSDGMGDIGNLPITLETDTVGQFAVVGTSEELAQDTLTPHAEDALREPARLDLVFAGNAADVLLEPVPDSDGALTGRLTDGIEKKVRNRLAGDAGTVSTQTKGLILDSDELDRQTRAVAAVANEFETASSR